MFKIWTPVNGQTDSVSCCNDASLTTYQGTPLLKSRFESGHIRSGEGGSWKHGLLTDCCDYFFIKREEILFNQIGKQNKISYQESHQAATGLGSLFNQDYKDSDWADFTFLHSFKVRILSHRNKYSFLSYTFQMITFEFCFGIKKAETWGEKNKKIWMANPLTMLSSFSSLLFPCLITYSTIAIMFDVINTFLSFVCLGEWQTMKHPEG